MRDTRVIQAFCREVGGLTAVATMLSTREQQLTPQHIYNWRKRGRVAPEQRLHFLQTYNRVMPKDRQLGLEWLAAPAAKHNNGSANHGGKSRRKARPPEAARRRQAQDKRGEARPRP